MEAHQIRLQDCEMAFAVPGQNNIIDLILPNTGLSWHFRETLEQIRLRYPGAEVVNFKAFREEIERRENQPFHWLETSREQYWDMLEVLPPAMMQGGAFLVGEACDHHGKAGAARFQGFISRHNQYLTSSRPITRAEMTEAIQRAWA